MGATAKASTQGIAKVKQAIDKKGWRKTSPVFSDAACVSVATLKRFWRGVPISLDSFDSICQAVSIDLAQVVAVDPPAELTGWRSLPSEKSPIAENSVTLGSSHTQSASTQLDHSHPTAAEIDPASRQSLRQSLRHQLLASMRVLAITGLTGTGKTTLAHQIASDMAADGYDSIYLTCDPTAPLTLASVVHALSKCTSDGFAFSLLELNDRLTSRKYLFILDNCEHLLADDPNLGWGHFQSSIWQKFFHSILSAPTCNSRFILTSQDIPNAIGHLCQQQPERGYVCAIAGLTFAEQTALFQAQGLTDPKPSDCLIKIGQAYAGHPLALQTIATDIAAHHPSPAAYWHHSATANLHRYSRTLQSTVEPRLVQTIARLKSQSPDAFELLCASSRYPTPLDSQSWQQIAQSIELTPGHYRNLLDLLCDRALIIPIVIQNRLHFYPHPLIRSLMLTQIHGHPNPVLSRAKPVAHTNR